ncbi:MAG TPA: hypothetical protein DC049_08800 [Spirochaetia bacterium]|nr:hypothetical protein [Spirochaetia bacterium]
MPVNELISILAVSFAAGIIQGGTGFGYGIFSMALLPFFMDIRHASALLVFSSLTVNFVIFFRLRSFFRFDRLLPLVISAALGVPAGVFFLTAADKNILLFILGIILIAGAAASVFTLPGKNNEWHAYKAGIPFGLLSGILHGAFAAGGPPTVVFINSQNFSRFRYAASVQFVFGICTMLRGVFIGSAGIYTRQLVFIGMSSAVFSAAGVLLGLFVLSRLDDKKLKYIIALFIVAVGIKNITAFIL